MKKLTVKELRELNILAFDVTTESRVNTSSIYSEPESRKPWYWLVIKATDVISEKDLTDYEKKNSIIHIALNFNRETNENAIRILNKNLDTVKCIEIEESYDSSRTNKELVELVLSYLK